MFNSRCKVAVWRSNRWPGDSCQLKLPPVAHRKRLHFALTQPRARRAPLIRSGFNKRTGRTSTCCTPATWQPTRSSPCPRRTSTTASRGARSTTSSCSGTTKTCQRVERTASGFCPASAVGAVAKGGDAKGNWLDPKSWNKNQKNTAIAVIGGILRHHSRDPHPNFAK